MQTTALDVLERLIEATYTAPAVHVMRVDGPHP